MPMTRLRRNQPFAYYLAMRKIRSQSVLLSAVSAAETRAARPALASRFDAERPEKERRAAGSSFKTRA
jgi:hypothetical protein